MNIPTGLATKGCLALLTITCVVALTRHVGKSDENMIYFASANVQLGGEPHPVLDNLRGESAVDIDKMQGMIPRKHQYKLTQSIWLSRHEVTNSQYRAFAAMTQMRKGSFASFAHPDTPIDHQFKPQTLRDIKYAGSRQPIVNVSWFDAFAYCKIAGMRLPTANEYEAAFQIDAALRQDSEFDYNKDKTSGQVVPLDINKQPTVRGVFQDLIGNVMEWVAPNEGKHFLMGYSYKDYEKSRTREHFLAYRRIYQAKSQIANDFGFRCAYEPSDADMVRLNQRPPTLNRDGVICHETRSVKGLLFPQQMCQLPKKTYQLGMDKRTATVDMIHQKPWGYAQYLLGRPSKTINLPGFWLDAQEVTISQYQDFLSVLSPSKQWYGHPEQPNSVSHRPDKWQIQLNDDPNNPVTGVNWWNAFAYCSWQNKRLPFSDEWESAAKGNDSRLYSWGNESIANDKSDTTAKGIMGLTRNVSEWTATFLTSTDAAVVKGGSRFYDWTIFGRSYVELKLPRDVKSAAVGFRCARNG
jgi:formylglycine-generating enzyme required for sulfatase activity